MKLRSFEEKLFKVLMILSASVVLLSLVLIIGTVFIKGISAMNLDMIIKSPSGGYYLGKEGGVLNAIVGSILLTGLATIISIVISIPVVIYLNLYARESSRFAAVVRIALELLWGIPSIVYGAFGFIIMIYLGMKASLLAGIIAVALMIFPIMSRSIDEVMQMVMPELAEASYSLGATKYETAYKVILRQTMPGIISAVLIAFGRGVGDAASVLFTAGFSDRVPLSLFEPAATLPLAIFFQLGTPFPAVQQRAYASALILTVLILLVSIISRLLTAKFNKHIIK
jgi:phosphate transport system permease protein